MNKYTLIIAVILTICVGCVGYFDKEDHQDEDEIYCEMVGLWAIDEEEGLPDNRRRGWPNFKDLDC